MNIPAEGAAGGWVLANGSDIKHLTSATDRALYAYCFNGLTHALYKSTDGGLRWSFLHDVPVAVRGIAVSPNNPKIIYYATDDTAYRSEDGGKNFIALPAIPGGVGVANKTISSIAVTWLNSNIIAVGTVDGDSLEYGGVYILNESDILPSWSDTNVGNYDICGLGFSPDYSLGRQIIAVVTNETDTFVFNKIGNSDWNAFISPAKLNKDNSITPVSIAANKSVVAFPLNYHIDTAATNNFFFVGVDTGTGDGDVYRIDCADVPEFSRATDLNCGSPYGEVNTDITGLAAYYDDRYSLLLAGAATHSRVYISQAGGSSWIKSLKEPTGGTNTEVVMAPDFTDTGVIYAATSGADSALSISRDIGVSWNQISFIDTIINNIVDFVPSPEASSASALFMVTSGAGQSLWRSLDNGGNWERILSSHAPGLNSLSLVNLPPQYGTDCWSVFATGQSNGNPAILESINNGQSFRCWLTCDPVTGAAFDIDVWAVTSESTIYIGSGHPSKLYRTTNSGYTYSPSTPVSTSTLYSLAVSPNFKYDGVILAGHDDGWIHWSSDNGSSFQSLPVGASAAPLDGNITVAFDPDFSINHTVYAASGNADGGIFRFIIGSSTDWEQMDTTLPAGAVIVQLAFSASGVLYAANYDADGGMERCLDPRLASNTTFETVIRGLNSGAILSGLWQRNGQLWSVDSHDINDIRLMTYYDTLALPVTPVSPENGLPGIGSLVNHGVKNITIEWEKLEGATSYEWQCNYDTDFSAVPADLHGTTSAGSIRLPSLEPATTYYWRVRAGAPVLSPWSVPRSFTTSMDTESVNLKPDTPAPGATEVSIRPIFQWTAVLGAEAYEMLLATDAAFNHPVIIKINEYALKTNAWNCDITLELNTVYYWKVRAVTATTSSAWSSVGIFTTISTLPADETLPFNSPASPELLMALSPPTISPPPTVSPSAPTSPAAIGSFFDMPAWLLYFIGGLLAIVFLSLLIVLVVVVKIKRL